MKQEKCRAFGCPAAMLAAFGLWTAAVQCVDVQRIGPQGSAVGFAAMNRFVHELTGVHMPLYILTDWLSLVPALFVLGFAVLGLGQWIRRKHLLKVDRDLLILGGFYLAVLGAYGLFEVLAVNYRPVLIDGVLEASYPSSTTMLVLCVMPTAIMQLRARIQNAALRGWAVSGMGVFTAFMVIARLISGVHWLSDIIGGALLSAALVLLYRALVRCWG